MLSAHRLSWELHRGSIPDGMVICHKCDTPSCVNPDHLFVGTITDNNRDTVSKGRHKHGMGTARLTEDDIRQIRAIDAPQDFVGDLYGIGRNHVSNIKCGRKWAHI